MAEEYRKYQEEHGITDDELEEFGECVGIEEEETISFPSKASKISAIATKLHWSIMRRLNYLNGIGSDCMYNVGQQMVKRNIVYSISVARSQDSTQSYCQCSLVSSLLPIPPV